VAHPHLTHFEKEMEMSMSKQDLEALGYKQVGEPFYDQAGITESDLVTLFHKDSEGIDILMLHKYKQAAQDRYFLEVSLATLREGS
jgi:hypothetical protein